MSVKVCTAALVRDEQGKVLIIQRGSECPHNIGKWEFPCGKMEQGESTLDCAIRELKEETGLIANWVFQPAKITERSDSGWIFFCYDMLYLTMTQQFVIMEKGKVDDYAWVTPLELLSYDLTNYTEQIVSEHF